MSERGSRSTIMDLSFEAYERGDSPANKFVVVYQPGKVASESLEQLFASMPETVSHQAHFLGEAALMEVLKEILDPSQPTGLKQHKEWHLRKNIRAQFLINRIEGDYLPGWTAHFVTPLRKPLDFFRSALIQRYDVYSSMLSPPPKEPISRATSTALQSTVHAGLARFSELFALFSEHEPSQLQKGIFDRFERWLVDLQGLAQTEAARMVAIARLMLRMDAWALWHAPSYLGFRLDQMNRMTEAVLHRKSTKGSTYVFRYEDLPWVLSSVVQSIYGSELPVELPYLNEARVKPGAEEVSGAFEDPSIYEPLQAAYHRLSWVTKAFYS